MCARPAWWSDAWIPGNTRRGSPAGAALHVARTVSRRAEVHALLLGDDAVEPVVLIYLNRLSDLLWILARTA